jgi:hypothetical protein
MRYYEIGKETPLPAAMLRLMTSFSNVDDGEKGGEM